MFHCLPNSDWADGNLAEAAVQLGKMVEHLNESQPNTGPRADGILCRWESYIAILRKTEKSPKRHLRLITYMSIHDVEVEVVGTGLEKPVRLVGQRREIRVQDRGTDLTCDDK